MNWSHHQTMPAAAAETGLRRSEGECVLTLPLATREERVCAWLHVVYRTSEPLTVDASIRSPSGAPAVERTVLRRDLRTALCEPVFLPGMTVGPASAPGVIVFVFEEQSVSVPVTVPAGSFSEFLRACETLVPMNERAETDAVTRALELAQQRWV